MRMKRIVRDISHFNFLSFLSSKLREEKEFFVYMEMMPRGLKLFILFLFNRKNDLPLLFK